MQAELHLIDIQEEKANAVQLEAAYVARRIARLMTDGSTVWENGAPRPVRFGDVCILLRSPKNKAQVYREAFLKEGINSWSDSRNGFLQAREIRVMVAFLQMLDNPYRDIPLLTVLMSDLFGFTPDQIAKIRLLDQRGSFYSALQESARQGNESSAAFLRQTQLLRRLAGQHAGSRTFDGDLRQNRLSGDCVRLSDGTGEKGESASALQFCGSF